MKTIQFLILLLLTISVNALAQRTLQFGKFTDKDGVNIKGTSMERGFERQIYIDQYSVNTTNETIVTISIPNSEAVASFQDIVDSKFSLQNGEISVLKIESERKVLSQKITMSAIKVISVNITDEAATLVLQPQTYNVTYANIPKK